MASVLAASPYNNQANPTFPHTPQPPPSPPVDDPSNKCILPSIQTLIGMADSPSSQNESERPPHQQLEGGFSHDSRPYPYGLPTVSNPKALPLTPPLRPASGFDGSRQSPSESSSYYSAAAINNVEPHQQRQPAPPTSVDSYPMPRHPSQSPYANSAYASSPGAMSTYSYPSPANPPMTSSTMYYQRPIPSTFPPAIAVAIDPSLAGAHEISPVDQSNPWQHHHYISPSSSAAFA
ncbi:hypothetical protein MMC06_005210, partial [Schaereria dolodes]|nr:hypothetical protein [Schaereria dolodes]